VQVQTAFDFCRPPARARKPERLFFALMPDEAAAFVLREFLDRFLIANGVEAVRLKPLVALQRLGESKGPALYGAKLAGQAVPAAGLTLKFDSVGTVVTPERRVLALTARDPALAGVHAALRTAIAQNGLKADDAAPFLPLAHGLARMPPEAIKPVKIRVTGLALLRGEQTGDFSVLRRWPLNAVSRPSRRLDGAATNRNLTA
jgi:2'-5' RNA ligase